MRCLGNVEKAIATVGTRDTVAATAGAAGLRAGDVACIDEIAEAAEDGATAVFPTVFDGLDGVGVGGREGQQCGDELSAQHGFGSIG